MDRVTGLYLRCLELIDSVKDESGDAQFKYTNIWDNHIEEIIGNPEVDNYAFRMPACFVEVDFGEPRELGLGMTSYPDCEILLHFCNWILDGGLGTMERNIEIFGIRARLKNVFKKSNIDFCSSLQTCLEKPDYKHKGVYHYVLGFKTNFLDNTGYTLSDAIFAKLVAPTLNINVILDWESGKQYEQNVNYVWYGDGIYLCSVSNSDETFIIANWTLIKSWIPKQFEIDDYTIFYGKIYKCIIANNDAAFNQNNWNKITQG
jgi:hypothetical protein